VEVRASLFVPNTLAEDGGPFDAAIWLSWRAVVKLGLDVEHTLGFLGKQNAIVDWVVKLIARAAASKAVTSIAIIANAVLFFTTLYDGVYY
jgi:inorganic pyrophosphatase